MPTEPNRPEGAAEDDESPKELPRSPDGPGPKDVPDEQVIDKTLPGQPRGEQPRE